MRFHNIKLLFLSIVLIFLGCAAGHQLSPMQKRQLTTRLIDGSYEDTFRATITVLQDQGYVIKNTDMASGLIVANVDRAESGGSQFAQALLLGYIANKGTEVEISCMVSKIADYKSEIRLNIQEVTYGQSSLWSGTSKQNTKQIYDPNIYRNLFNEIEIEVRRRQAISGNVINYPASNSKFENELNYLFDEENQAPIYLDIKNTAKGKYALININNNISMKLGENYDLIRFKDVNNQQEGIIKIGTAKVIQIKENKVALEYMLFDPKIMLTKEDKLQYK